ncbi:MAG: flavin reductase family protein [Pseudomonadota bacterium]
MDQSADLKTQFLNGMSLAAASVSVVATDGPAGRAGVTVSAMTSISADGPRPTMLACLNASSRTLAKLLENRTFSINVLTCDQQAVADVFSGRSEPPRGDKFSGVDTAAGVTGAPRLIGALVSFDCRLVSADKVGTHHICIGAVEAVVAAEDGTPLLYGMRQYLRPESA